jgi:hypothetical protein
MCRFSKILDLKTSEGRNSFEYFTMVIIFAP